MPAQRSFEDLGTPLSGVTFCVIDLETTGGSAAEDAITEVGALKVRCGETLGTFHTLVDPEREVPAFIRLLTGISHDMLVEAPRIQAVLPSLLEFVRGTVLVAHNARFDVSFLNAALARNEYPTLTNRVVDTATIARKTLAGEVPNNKLATLAGYLRCAHQPSHRAFADALATTDLLHHLIERVAGYGVTTLEDLCAMSFTRMDGTWRKISLADGIPRGIGVYRFVGAGGTTLYVGKATDLRSRVRSYFYGDPRRKIRDLLRETQDIVVEPHATTLEAEVAEARAIAEQSPPYNRAGKRKPIWYLKVTLDGSRARMSRVRTPRSDGAIYVGPLEARAVHALMDAARDALTIHRCSTPARCHGCVFSQMGRCSGLDPARHTEDIRRLAVALEFDPNGLLEPVLARMKTLAGAERFEEAAEVRERGALLERTLVHRLEHAALGEGRRCRPDDLGPRYLAALRTTGGGRRPRPGRRAGKGLDPRCEPGRCSGLHHGGSRAGGPGDRVVAASQPVGRTDPSRERNLVVAHRRPSPRPLQAGPGSASDRRLYDPGSEGLRRFDQPP